jgi:SurA-like protein
MKIRKIILLILLISSFVFTQCENKSDVAVKIDDDVITVQEFELAYYAQLKVVMGKSTNEEVDKHMAETGQSVSSKKMFMDQLVSNKLIYLEAENDKDIDKNELAVMEEMGRVQAVNQYYLYKKFKDKLNFSDDDINKFYKKNQKTMYRGRPLSDKVVNDIKARLSKGKFQQETQIYLMSLVQKRKVDRGGFDKYMSKVEKKSDSSEIDKIIKDK